MTLLLATVLVAGCGAADPPEDRRAKSPEKKEADARCSGGEGHLQVSDVLDEAPRYRIANANEEALRPLTEPLRKVLGDRLRGFETAVVVPRGGKAGTVVIISNLNESAGEPGDDAVAGARDAAERNGWNYEEITVADEPAVIVQQPDVFTVALGLGECSTAMLHDVDRKRLLRTAAAMHAPT